MRRKLKADAPRRNLVNGLISTQVAQLRYHTDADTGAFKGFCHVEFCDERSLETAHQRRGNIDTV